MKNEIHSAASKRSPAEIDKMLSEIKVPTLPIIARKLVELCNDENATFADFARIIASDPGLSSRILQVVNSAYYGLRNKATTLEYAISVLGLKYVKIASLGFHLATTLNKFSNNGFKMAEFWRENLLRGVMARQLARRYCPDRQEEAFLIGLLQDCGIPLLVQILGEKYALMWSECQGSPAALLQLEQKLFEIDHLMAAETLVQKWSLPELLAQPICAHHERPQSSPSHDEKIQLCQIAYFVGTLPLNHPSAVSEEDITLSEYGRDVFGLDEESLSELLKHSDEQFNQLAKLYRDILPDQLDVTELLEQAKDQLTQLISEGPNNIFSLEEELKRLRVRCADLSHSVDEFAQQAESDDLTGLSVRNRLDRFLDDACWKVKNNETTLTIIFLDIDDFSDINNEHSHAAGDRLLQSLAELFREIFNDQGCVCRYGGDEFVIALLGINFKQAVQYAQTLTAKIRALRIPVRSSHGPVSIGFSCSIGMLFCESGSQPGNGARVQELADNQMYEVKKSGKNDMRFQVIPAGKSDAVKDEDLTPQEKSD